MSAFLRKRLALLPRFAPRFGMALTANNPDFCKGRAGDVLRMLIIRNQRIDRGKQVSASYATASTGSVFLRIPALAHGLQKVAPA
jgi:hypothetical protein